MIRLKSVSVLCMAPIFAGIMTSQSAAFSVRAWSQVNITEMEAVSQDTGWLEGVSEAHASVSNSDPQQQGGGGTSGSASADALIGSLKGYSWLETTNQYWNGPGETNCRSNFRDVITVQSSVLNPGDPVTVVLNTELDGLFTWTPAFAALIAHAYSRFSVATSMAQSDKDLNYWGGLTEYATGPQLLNTTVGAVLNVEGELNIHSAIYQAAMPYRAVTSDFSPSALFHLDAQTPGVRLTSGSGHDYSSAVSSVPGIAPVPGKLLTVFPNPARAGISMAFDIPQAGAVDVSVFDASGRRIRNIPLGPLAAAVHSVTWDGKDGNGCDVPAGIYYIRVDAPGIRLAGKASIIR